MSAIKKFLTYNDLSNSLLMGYYGGGNYGDELLLEILMNILRDKHTKGVTIFYKDPSKYQIYHKDFGFDLVNRGQLFKVLHAIIKKKRIIVGGGGLWGRDVNQNILFLSVLLFLSHFILRKKIDLIGVGYYRSTSRMGHISAWLVAKAANTIIARDKESYDLFFRYKKDTTIDNDIAFLLPNINQAHYQDDVQVFQKKVTLPKGEKFVFVALRRYGRGELTSYDTFIQSLIAHNPQVTFLVALLETPKDFPKGDALLHNIASKYKNAQYVDTAVNPFTLFGFFAANQKQMLLIAPQFHAILSAYLTNIPFLPIAYDNKVKELFHIIGDKRIIDIGDVKTDDFQHFIDTHTQEGDA